MNYHDVALVNGSLDQLGQSLLHNRMLDQQASENAADRSLRGAALTQQERENALDRAMREKVLTSQDQRAQVDDKRQQEAVDELKRHHGALESGHVSAWIQGPDGGIMNFQGPRAAFDDMSTRAQAAGQPFKIVAQPKAQTAYATIKKETPSGTFTFYAQSPDDFEHAKLAVAKLDSMPPKPGFKTAPIANKEAYDAEIAKARALDLSGDTDAAQRIFDNAERFFAPAQKPTASENLATVTSGHDSMGKPQTTISQRIDPNKAQPVPASKADLLKGFLYSTAKGPARWNGTQFIPEK